MTQYWICVKCQKIKDRMIVYHGDSYCLECCKSILQIKSKAYVGVQEADNMLKGLSELFD